MSELKPLPCPFCGGEPKINHYPEWGWAQYEIKCSKCRATLDEAFLNESKAKIAWNRRAQPDNAPLTLDELRGMDGEPVWVYFIDSKVSINGQWHLVRNITKEAINCFENYMPFCDYGKTWVAYRRKPEGGEG